MNQTIRQRVIEAALPCLPTHEKNISSRAARYFDIALQAGAEEYTAAALALNGLAADYTTWANELDDPRSYAPNDGPRIQRFRSASCELSAASRRFRLAGEQAAFDRLVKAAELAA